VNSLIRLNVAAILIQWSITQTIDLARLVDAVQCQIVFVRLKRGQNEESEANEAMILDESETENLNLQQKSLHFYIDAHKVLLTITNKKPTAPQYHSSWECMLQDICAKVEFSVDFKSEFAKLLHVTEIDA